MNLVKQSYLNTQKNTPLMNKSPFLKMERGVPKMVGDMGPFGPVPNGFGTTSPRTCSYTMSIPLPMSGSRPGVGWLPAL